MSNLTIEEAYKRALTRQIGGIMPYNLTESTPTVREKRGVKKKVKPKKKEYIALNKREMNRERNKRYYARKKLKGNG